MRGKCGHDLRKIMGVWYCDIDGQQQPWTKGLRFKYLEEYGIVDKESWRFYEKSRN